MNGRGGVSTHQGTCVGTLRLRREPSELVPTMCARAWRFRKSSEYRPLWPYSGCFASTCHLSQHSPNLCWCPARHAKRNERKRGEQGRKGRWSRHAPVSSDQHCGMWQKTQLLHGFLAFFGSAACAAQRSQHSAAEVVLCVRPHATASPPGSLCGSSPHIAGVVTPGQSSKQLSTVSGSSHNPLPHRGRGGDVATAVGAAVGVAAAGLTLAVVGTAAPV